MEAQRKVLYNISDVSENEGYFNTRNSPERLL